MVTSFDTALCDFQAENEALQRLVLEVAQNKQDAQRKVAALCENYGVLLAKVCCPTASCAHVVHHIIYKTQHSKS